MLQLDDRCALTNSSSLVGVANMPDIACECMLCDLPVGATHGPVEWSVTVDFPGPYPFPGRDVMLLCTHCKESWLADDWPKRYDNFIVVRCVPI